MTPGSVCTPARSGPRAPSLASPGRRSRGAPPHTSTARSYWRASGSCVARAAPCTHLVFSPPRPGPQSSRPPVPGPFPSAPDRPAPRARQSRRTRTPCLTAKTRPVHMSRGGKSWWAVPSVSACHALQPPAHQSQSGVRRLTILKSCASSSPATVFGALRGGGGTTSLFPRSDLGRFTPVASFRLGGIARRAT